MGIFQLIGNTINSESVYKGINNSTDRYSSINLCLEATPYMTQEDAVAAFRTAFIEPLGITEITFPAACPNTNSITYSFTPATTISVAKLTVSMFGITTPERMFNTARLFAAITTGSRANTIIASLCAKASYSDQAINRLRWIRSHDNIEYDYSTHKIIFKFERIPDKTIEEHNEIIEQHMFLRGFEILKVIVDTKASSMFVDDEYHLLVEVIHPADMLFGLRIALRTGFLDRSGGGMYNIYDTLIDEIFPQLM